METNKVLKRVSEKPLPKIGDIIVFNEIKTYSESHVGKLCNLHRGIGEVVCFTNILVVLKVMHGVGIFSTGSLLINDFRFGIYEYVRLKEFPEEICSYIDLDIKKLCEQLKQREI